MPPRAPTQHRYIVRVDHSTGDHEFWTLRRRTTGAKKMARRFRAQYTGFGDTFTVVEISRADLDLHSRYGYECTSRTRQLTPTTSAASNPHSALRALPLPDRNPEDPLQRAVRLRRPERLVGSKSLSASGC